MSEVTERSVNNRYRFASAACGGSPGKGRCGTPAPGRRAGRPPAPPAQAPRLLEILQRPLLFYTTRQRMYICTTATSHFRLAHPGRVVLDHAGWTKKNICAMLLEAQRFLSFLACL